MDSLNKKGIFDKDFSKKTETKMPPAPSPPQNVLSSKSNNTQNFRNPNVVYKNQSYPRVALPAENCYYCGILGHFTTGCFKRQTDEENGNYYKYNYAAKTKAYKEANDPQNSLNSVRNNSNNRHPQQQNSLNGRSGFRNPNSNSANNRTYDNRGANNNGRQRNFSNGSFQEMPRQQNQRNGNGQNRQNNNRDMNFSKSNNKENSTFQRSNSNEKPNFQRNNSYEKPSQTRRNSGNKTYAAAVMSQPSEMFVSEKQLATLIANVSKEMSKNGKKKGSNVPKNSQKQD
jgi:hypothetical protein